MAEWGCAVAGQIVEINIRLVIVAITGIIYSFTIGREHGLIVITGTIGDIYRIAEAECIVVLIEVKKPDIAVG
jgi:hypothetical protein